MRLRYFSLFNGILMENKKLLWPGLLVYMFLITMAFQAHGMYQTKSKVLPAENSQTLNQNDAQSQQYLALRVNAGDKVASDAVIIDVKQDKLLSKERCVQGLVITLMGTFLFGLGYGMHVLGM